MLEQLWLSKANKLEKKYFQNRILIADLKNLNWLSNDYSVMKKKSLKRNRLSVINMKSRQFLVVSSIENIVFCNFFCRLFSICHTFSLSVLSWQVESTNGFCLFSRSFNWFWWKVRWLFRWCTPWTWYHYSGEPICYRAGPR